jgi:hypothetical protein
MFPTEETMSIETMSVEYGGCGSLPLLICIVEVVVVNPCCLRRMVGSKEAGTLQFRVTACRLSFCY